MRPGNRKSALIGGLAGAAGAGLGVSLAPLLPSPWGWAASLVSAATVGTLGGWLASAVLSRSGTPSHESAAGTLPNASRAEFAQFLAEVENGTHDLVESTGRAVSGAIVQGEAMSRASLLMGTLLAQADHEAQNADAAAVEIRQVREHAELARARIEEATVGMDRLRLFAESNGRKVRRHSDRSAEITAIVGTITGISQRTDLLALNATIESVRAGANGRGFALVVEEIRKLAERTADATREIGALAEVIQAETTESMRSLEAEQHEVDRQIRRIHETGVALSRIGEASARSGKFAEAIATESADQAATAEELGRIAQRVVATSQASVEEVRRSRERVATIARQTERLRRMLGAYASTRSEPAFTFSQSDPRHLATE